MKRIVGFVLLIVMLLLCGCEARPKTMIRHPFPIGILMPRR